MVDGGGATLPQSRCLKRGLAVLTALNQYRFATAATIARSVNVPRPTVHRLLVALAADGFVEQVGDSEYFAVVGGVSKLASGWDRQARALAHARAAIDDLAEAVEWPIDLAIFDGGAMVVRDSTFGRGARSLLPRSPVGQRIPLRGSAPGRMYLAGLDPVDREAFLDPDARDERQAIERAGRRGYAVRDGGIVPRTTAIAVPVIDSGRTLLCITIAFIRSAIPLSDAIPLHLPWLRRIAAAVEGSLRSS